MTLSKIESNDKAISLFESIKDYSDSVLKIEQCKKNIKEINEKILHTKNLRRKIMIGVVLAIILVNIISGLISNYNKKLERERQEKVRIEREAREAKEKAELEARLATNIQTLSPSILANMVKCSAGSFMMGSPSGELGGNSDETQHQVTISKPFYIGKYEVTQKEFEAVMGTDPSKFRGENKPVECVSWNDAKEFCEKLNKYAKNIPQGYKFDLPTEAQWEYACRAGTTTSFNSGKNITIYSDYWQTCANLDEVGWYYSNSGSKTHEIGQKKPNAWGIFDMHGNVREWCKDWYGDYPSSSVTDPTGSNSGSDRVTRGGSWGINASFCRSANRRFFNPDLWRGIIGFRLALVPIE